jgi:hypothetical protein
MTPKLHKNLRHPESARVEDGRRLANEIAQMEAPAAFSWLGTAAGVDAFGNGMRMRLGLLLKMGGWLLCIAWRSDDNDNGNNNW